MPSRTQIINLTGGQIVFPVQLGQARIGFEVAAFSITNNTDSTLYLSRSVVTPTATQSDFTVPPRSTVGVFGWYCDTIYVGSSGATVLATDSLTFQLNAEESGSPFVASAIPITASQIRRIQQVRIPVSVVVTGGAPGVQSGSGTAAILPVTVNKTFIIKRGEELDPTTAAVPTTDGSLVFTCILTSSVLVTGTVSFFYFGASFGTNRWFIDVTVVEYI